MLMTNMSKVYERIFKYQHICIIYAYILYYTCNMYENKFERRVQTGWMTSGPVVILSGSQLQLWIQKWDLDQCTQSDAFSLTSACIRSCGCWGHRPHGYSKRREGKKERK